MAADLLRRIRKARESTVTIEPYKFIIRRPTDAEASELFGGNPSVIEIVRRFVVGWENVTDADLVPSGGSDAAQFSPDLWSEWVSDRPDFWAPLFDAIVSAYTHHQNELEAAGKL